MAAQGFDLDAEIKRLEQINKDRDKLYAEARDIVEALKGITHSSSASTAQRNRIKKAIKPYTRQRKS
jgi:hypothetical protein